MNPTPTKELNRSQINPLIETSLSEGFNFLLRLIDEWENGKNRFNKPNERLYQIEVGGEIVGIGGINNDPYSSSNKDGRIRHLYIHPNHRGKGFGKKIVRTIIADFGSNYEKFTLRTTTEAAAKFYEALGFRRVTDSKTNTHEMLATKSTTYHLAQINIAEALAPLDSEIMSGFVEGLERINHLAEGSEGFVWRLKDDDVGNATDIQVFDNPLIIVNLSIWENLEHLKAFTFHTEHAHFLRNRKQWFKKMDVPPYVLWWIRAGTIPTVEEGKKALQHLAENGATEAAFDFKRCFDAPTE